MITSCLQIARPSPVPPYFRAVSSLTCMYFLNRVGKALSVASNERVWLLQPVVNYVKYKLRAFDKHTWYSNSRIINITAYPHSCFAWLRVVLFMSIHWGSISNWSFGFIIKWMIFVRTFQKCWSLKTFPLTATLWQWQTFIFFLYICWNCWLIFWDLLIRSFSQSTRWCWYHIELYSNLPFMGKLDRIAGENRKL